MLCRLLSYRDASRSNGPFPLYTSALPASYLADFDLSLFLALTLCHHNCFSGLAILFPVFYQAPFTAENRPCHLVTLYFMLIVSNNSIWMCAVACNTINPIKKIVFAYSACFFNFPLLTNWDYGKPYIMGLKLMFTLNWGSSYAMLLEQKLTIDNKKNNNCIALCIRKKRQSGCTKLLFTILSVSYFEVKEIKHTSNSLFYAIISTCNSPWIRWI